MTFSKRIRDLRENKGVLQKEVAKHIGVSERVYGFYEAGRFPKDEQILISIANYFDVSVDYLIGRVDKPYQKIIDKNLPQELVDAKIQAIKVFKDLKVEDLTAEQIKFLVDFAEKVQKDRQG